VIVTGAFIAQHAEIVDGKLNVTGGVLSKWKVDAERIARFHVVVLTQAETDNTDRRIVVEVFPPDVVSGEPLRVADQDLPDETARHEIGFAVYQIGMTMRFNGRWRILITASGGAASLPLNVRGPNGE
jgi:hypothetical protein